MVFVDEVTIHLYSGNGGKGCEAYFRRSDKKQIPTGGDGGNGGDVIIRADRNVTSLYSFVLNKHYRAEAGQQGGGNQKKGRDGKDIIVRVPCGTTIYNKEERLLVRDLVEDGEEVIAAQGGRGGIGNAHKGRDIVPPKLGSSFEVILNLRLNSDVFLIGSPNSGRSQLLQALTHSRVKSEIYPFSTKAPQLGTYECGDYTSLALCELPALIEGSSKGRGLGNQFLKHTTRAKLLFLMLDPLREGFDPMQDYTALMEELKAYDQQLTEIPRFVIINKVDESWDREDAEQKRMTIPDPVFFVSAKTGEGIQELMKEAEKAIKNASAV